MTRQPFSTRPFNCQFATCALSLVILSFFEFSLAGQVPRDEVVPHPIGQADSQPSPSDSSSTLVNNDAKSVEKKPVSAEAIDPVSRDLQNIAHAARKQLSADKLPQAASAKRELIAAIDNLERFLSTNPQQFASWKNFLRLDAMREEAHAEQPNPAILVDLETSMRQNYLGLEYPQYTRVRDGLMHFHRALRFGSAPEQTLKAIDLRLEKLIESLNDPVTDTDTERAEAVGVIANYLELTGQAPESLSAMRAKFSQPNVQAYVRESFVTGILVRPVAQPTAVNECLLGTRVVGSACLNGNVSADLMPSNNGVSLCLTLNANLSTNNTGYNRGVVLRSTGSSPILAAKQIFVNPTGISSTAASVATNLQTQINSIEHRSRIVRRIATRKAAETQPQANVVAEGRLQDRVRTQFDQQVEEQLSQSRVQLASFQKDAQSRPVLTRIGLPKPSYSYNSSSTAIYGVLTQRSTSQLAAVKPCDLPKPADAAIVIEAHQSAMMNAIDVFLAGRTLRNHDLDDLVRQFDGKVTPELEKEANADPWSITFAAFHPIQIELNDGVVRLTLRIGQMTRGDQVLKQDATVSATYRPTISNGNLRLDREGDVKIEFYGKISNIGAVSTRAFLKGKFEETFKPVLVNTPVDLPAPKQANVPRVQISSLLLDNGWLQINLN